MLPCFGKTIQQGTLGEVSVESRVISSVNDDCRYRMSPTQISSPYLERPKFNVIFVRSLPWYCIVPVLVLLRTQVPVRRTMAYCPPTTCSSRQGGGAHRCDHSALRRYYFPGRHGQTANSTGVVISSAICGIVQLVKDAKPGARLRPCCSFGASGIKL
jgi:hypothetical protein